MMKGRQREKREGRILGELESFYKKRKDKSVHDIPCPQNFIPGVNRGTLETYSVAENKLTYQPTVVRFKGIPVKVKDDFSVIEKGLLGAGLMSLSIPSPSNNTIYLEHSSAEHNNNGVSDNDLDNVSYVGNFHEIKTYDILHCTPVRKRSFSFPPLYASGDYDLIWGVSHVIDDAVEHESIDSLSASVQPFSDDSVKLSRKEKKANSILNPMITDYNYSDIMVYKRRSISVPNLTFCSSEIKVETGMPLENQILWAPKCITEPATKFDNMAEHVRHGNDDPSKVSPDIDQCTVNKEDNALTKSYEIKKTPSASKKDSKIDANSRLQQSEEDKRLSLNNTEKLDETGNISKKVSASMSNYNPDFDKMGHQQMQALSQIQEVMRAKLPKTFQATIKMGWNFDALGKRTTAKDEKKSRSVTRDKHFDYQKGGSNGHIEDSSALSIIAAPFICDTNNRGFLKSLFAKRVTMKEEHEVSPMSSSDDENLRDNQNIRKKGKGKDNKKSTTFPRIISSRDVKQGFPLGNIFSNTHNWTKNKKSLSKANSSGLNVGITEQLDVIEKDVMMISTRQQSEEKNEYENDLIEKKSSIRKQGEENLDALTEKQIDSQKNFNNYMPLYEQHQDKCQRSSFPSPVVTSNATINVEKASEPFHCKSTSSIPNYISSKMHVPNHTTATVQLDVQKIKPSIYVQRNASITDNQATYFIDSSNQETDQDNDYTQRRIRKSGAIERRSPLLSELRKVKPEHQRRTDEMEDAHYNATPNGGIVYPDEAIANIDDESIDSIKHRIAKEVIDTDGFQNNGNSLEELDYLVQKLMEQANSL